MVVKEKQKQIWFNESKHKELKTRTAKSGLNAMQDYIKLASDFYEARKNKR